MTASSGWGTRAVTVKATAAGASVTPITAPCRLKGWSLTATGTAASEADGSVTSPAAGATVVTTISLPAGDYSVEWTVELEGTLGAAVDNDNFRLVANAATQASSLNPGVAGTYPQQTQVIRLTAAGTISITTGILATVGAVYRAQIVATPSAPAAATLLDSGQVVGQSGAQFGFSDTQFLDEEGVYISTNVTVSVQQGTVSGCVYVKDYIDDSEL